MRRSQWMVLGIGLVLMSFVFSITAGMIGNCYEGFDEVKKSSVDMAKKGEADSGREWLYDFMSTANSCQDTVILNGSISTISFTVGIIFVIIGFLEPKKHHKQ